MHSIYEVLEAIFIAVFIATFLLNTGRSLKAIELCKECLIILKDKRQGMQEELYNICCFGIYYAMFRSYSVIADDTNAIQYGSKALVLFPEDSKKARFAIELAEIYQSQNKHIEAKELYERAINILIKIGDKEAEADVYGKLETMLYHLGEFVNAKEYTQKELVIRKEIGDRQGEATCYGHLGTVFHFLGEYLKAKEYHEKALVIRKAIGDRKGLGEAADYGNLGCEFYSLGEYVRAKEYHDKALVITKAIGDRKGEAADYGNLGAVYYSLGEYLKAKEYYEKALVISKAIGDKEGEATDYGNLGSVFHSLGEYLNAKEYYEKALVIRKAIGDTNGEATSYVYLGNVFKSLGKYLTAKEYYEKALTIKVEIGDTKGEATCYGNLGTVFHSLGEYLKGKEYHEKALVIRKAIGDRQGEAVDYGNIGSVFQSLGEYDKAEENIEKALSISKDIGDRQKELSCLCKLSLVKYSQGKPIQEVSRCLFQIIDKCENLRDFLVDNDQFKISFSDLIISPYQALTVLFCANGNSDQALYIVELGRARALADLMTSQYCAEKQISSDTQSWVGIESIMKKESNCTCLYIAYYGQHLFFWILRTSGVIAFRRISVNEDFPHVGSVSDLDDFFGQSFRSFGILPEDDCEDRSLNGIQPKSKSSQQGSSVLRLVEDDEEGSQFSEAMLHLSVYRMIIAPVADLLEEPEIIIVPDRSLYQVPFAALIDESGNYLSKTFRIRIAPSLTTLKLIQNSPADYHSQTGALIVGDPKVGQVFYKGCLENFKPLPCARKEADMIGQLLGFQPLLGEEATKWAVLQRLHSVSLIHIAAHGNAERGEIALSPLRTTHPIPQEEDYLLTMSDISQAQLRAKLVVLSCCHSGSGQIRAEGVVGIARAFLGSGARSVLVALWALEDRATEQLMSRFYEHLVRGESASESLHVAMKWMRATGYPKVCDWAPFMLIGDNVTFEFGK